MGACRDRQLLAEAAMQAFHANAWHFWASKKKAQAFMASSSRAKFRQKLQAWQRWAERRRLLRDNLKIVSIACRRTALAAGAAPTLMCPSLPCAATAFEFSQCQLHKHSMQPNKQIHFLVVKSG